MKETKNEQQEKLFLWWEYPEENIRFNAGVAFREDKYGEYRLKVDCYPQRRLYLKDLKTDEDKIVFQVEECKKIGDRHIRFEIGYGYSDSKTDGDVEITMAPHFDAKLVMSFPKAA